MNTVRGIGVTILGVLAVFLIWGVAVEPYLLDVENQSGPIPGLPAAWEGQRVAVLGDIQVGMWLANESTVRQAVEELVRERPALVLITGDFVYDALPDPAPQLQEVNGLLRPLTAAGIPTYAVLGNHDYAVEIDDEPVRPGQPTQDDDPEAGPEARQRLADDVRRALQSVGVVVLHNEAVPLPPPNGASADGGARLYLVGIAPHGPGVAAPREAVAAVPDGAPRLVLMHNPASFDHLPAESAQLAVAGHTHGGQVRLVPFMPDWSLLALLESGDVHADGWIPDYGAAGNRLYVNRGIGFSALPIRLFCPPELTRFTLRAADPNGL